LLMLLMLCCSCLLKEDLQKESAMLHCNLFIATKIESLRLLLLQNVKIFLSSWEKLSLNSGSAKKVQNTIFFKKIF